MANVRKATDTSMPHGRVSFPIACSACSKRRLGRWRWPLRPLVRRATGRGSTSEPACGVCGARLGSSEAWLAPVEERRDAFPVILGQARQRELVDVHVACEIVE